MKTKLEQELRDLKEALGIGTITTAEYCDLYYATSQKLKKL